MLGIVTDKNRPHAHIYLEAEIRCGADAACVLLTVDLFVSWVTLGVHHATSWAPGEREITLWQAKRQKQQQQKQQQQR